MGGCAVTCGLFSQDSALLAIWRCHPLQEPPATSSRFPLLMRPPNSRVAPLRLRRIRAASASRNGQPVNHSGDRTTSPQEVIAKDGLTGLHPEEVDVGASVKACIECGRVKQLEDFEKSTSSSDERNPACRACMAMLRARRAQRPLFHLGLSVEDAWEQAKTCTRCGNWKELRDFPRRGKGTNPWCRACTSKNKRTVRPVVDAPQKCNYCGEMKPACEYNRQQLSPNGIAGTCKDCSKAIGKARYGKYRVSPVILMRPEKMCSVCRQTKPTEEFHRSKAIDRLQPSCKPCTRQQQRARRNKKATVPAAQVSSEL